MDSPKPFRQSPAALHVFSLAQRNRRHAIIQIRAVGVAIQRLLPVPHGFGSLAAAIVHHADQAQRLRFAGEVLDDGLCNLDRLLSEGIEFLNRNRLSIGLRRDRIGRDLGFLLGGWTGLQLGRPYHGRRSTTALRRSRRGSMHRMRGSRPKSDYQPRHNHRDGKKQNRPPREDQANCRPSNLARNRGFTLL